MKEVHSVLMAKDTEFVLAAWHRELSNMIARKSHRLMQDLGKCDRRAEASSPEALGRQGYLVPE